MKSEQFSLYPPHFHTAPIWKILNRTMIINFIFATASLLHRTLINLRLTKIWRKEQTNNILHFKTEIFEDWHIYICTQKGCFLRRVCNFPSAMR